MELRSSLWCLFKNPWNAFKKDELAKEIAQIALPAAMALAADPLASLIDTAFIGHIGPKELAAVGVAIAVFNQVSKITIFPLVSITTSFVAEEDAAGFPRGEWQEVEMERGFSVDNEKDPLISKDELRNEMRTSTSNQVKMVEDGHQKRRIPSASTALLIASLLGIIQAVFLILTAKPLLNFMGVKSNSPMMKPARQYLTLRSIGAPAVLLSLAMQGVFRGFKDTKTPLYATIIGDAANVVLDPIFIFLFKMGVTGAAIAHVIAQYLIALLLMQRLTRHVNLLAPSTEDLQLGRFLKNIFLLLLRVIAATFSVTVAASSAARLGSTSMAAFQVCLQVWLATSLLADGLAVAGQAILASAFAKKEFDKATAVAARVLQLALVLGSALSVAVAVMLIFSAGLFTKDVNVLHLISLGIPFVALTQPINAIAFVFDGINFGASDFTYSAYSMILVAALSILCLFLLSSSHGFVGIWVALSIFMTLRAFFGFLRMGTRTGPWRYLRE